VAGEPKIIRDKGTHNLPGLKITGITAYHDTSHGAKRGVITMFKIQTEGISILHMGDIGHVPTTEMLGEIENVDVLMLPIGDTYTLGPENAKKTVELIAPRVIVPMHYKLPGLSLALRPVEDFTRQFTSESTVYVGKEIEVDRTELPDHQEIWVFSY
jgi:L-ascorbate metabolism protein UlaG (beta-lactamase superfamily)